MKFVGLSLLGEEKLVSSRLRLRIVQPTTCSSSSICSSLSSMKYFKHTLGSPLARTFVSRTLVVTDFDYVQVQYTYRYTGITDDEYSIFKCEVVEMGEDFTF